MKMLFISDIHGVPSTLDAALAKGAELGYDRLVLLGDLLATRKQMMASPLIEMHYI